MNYQEPPWTMNEKVELLTEAIKAVNPELLIEFIRRHGIQPNWGDVALPRGRTANQCQRVFNSMLNAGFSPGMVRSASVREAGPSSLMKRPLAPEMTFSGGRPLQPRPQIASIDTILNEPSEPPRKKRGRPTKEEAESRRQAASARGESYPPPRRERPASIVAGPSAAAAAAVAAAPLPSTTAVLAAQAVMTPPPARQGPHSTDTSESSSGKRRRGRPLKTEQEARKLLESAASPTQATPSRYPDILTRDEPPRTKTSTSTSTATTTITTKPPGPPGEHGTK
ncbi:hypothetical protein MBLNU459_g1706t1 [Dothideomycetes sp. NU459]